MARDGARESGFVARRVAFVAVVLTWTAVGEEFPAGGWNAWFGNEIMSVPAHYFYLAGTIVLLAPYLLSSLRWSLAGGLSKLGLWRWVVIGWIAVVIALFRAILSAAPNPFADWRNLLLTGLVAALAGRWLASEPWRSRALTDLAIGYGLVAAVHLAIWMGGGGTAVFGVRIPVFYGPMLYMAAFSSITLIFTWATTTRNRMTPMYGLLVRLGAVTSTLLVILSFRRSFWLAWAIGIVGVLYLLTRSRWSNPRGVLSLASILAVGVIVAFISLGTDNIATRLESFLPGADNRFSATNEDHINDMVDAWNVVADEPVFGFGIGRPYPTELIAEWKTDSFEVHNAFLHVWLKYGILGLIAYIGFHVGWIRSAMAASRHDRIGAHAVAALAVYLTGEMAATVVGTWPYGSTHISFFHGVLLAFTAVAILEEPAKSRAPRVAVPALRS